MHSAKDIANVLNSQYMKVFCKDSDENVSSESCRTSEIMQPVEISYRGILGLLERIKVGKACGPDSISGTMLKYCANIAAMFLQFIFTQSLDTGDIPEDWRTALVHPAFKGGNLKKPKNYRPISLTCICCKIMERILVSSMVTYLDDADLLSQCQHGFRKRLSCESQLIMLYQDLMSSIDKRKCIDLAFIDFSKAFDKVSHNHLISKLKSYNLDKNVLGWICSFLKNRTQRVIVDNVLSESIDVTSGVPQGSVLGPISDLVVQHTVMNNDRCI